MPGPAQKRGNAALWLGLLLTVLGFLSNFLYFLKVPQGMIPWINLILPAVGLVFLLIGLKRAFGQSQLYTGKIWGSVITGLAVLLFAGAVWLFVHVRDVPRSAGAPQIGERIPDFTLPDSSNEPVSLAQLFSSTANSRQPKAVLLIFYRGYW